MTREIIPDAVELIAPGLEIRRMGHRVPSEGGVSVHSLAVTTLSNKRLEGVPVAQKVFTYLDRTGKKITEQEAMRMTNVQKVPTKCFCYFDWSGKSITKEEAMEMADGVVYYQDATNPSKGRLRLRGSFIGEDDARTHVSGSRASHCSDIANLRDVDELGALPDLPEEEEDSEERREVREEAAGVHKNHRTKWLGFTCCCILSLVLVFGVRFLHLDLKEAETNTALLLGHLDPVRKEIGCDVGQFECLKRSAWQYMAGSVGSNMGLSKSLLSLLANHEADAGEDEGTVVRLLDGPVRKAEDGLPSEKLRELAVSETNRILASRHVGEILGDGTRREQQQAFRRIVRLLHPDKGLVSSSDPRASLALRLAFAARMASRLSD